MTYKKITIQHHEIKTQRQAIMWHLLNEKTCTSMEVWEKYKITRLSSIIHTLRNEGYNIETIDVQNMYVPDKLILLLYRSSVYLHVGL